ncbi:hypothetical protein ER57_00535 [Smithella sp. SCADC]|jgi:hypothetical protein|nr:hypothetical protein ER57_00535 [Smithella sp. SCADC]
MRISMPLFWFDLKGINLYSFDDTGISISPFMEDDIPKIPLFSEQDVRHIKNEAPWTLIYESADVEGYTTFIFSVCRLFFRRCHIISPLYPGELPNSSLLAVLALKLPPPVPLLAHLLPEYPSARLTQ